MYQRKKNVRVVSLSEERLKEMHSTLPVRALKPEYIDTHAHLNFVAFDSDHEKVIGRAEEARVGIINVGTQLDTSRKAVELAEKYENIWAIVGLHPIHTSKSFHDDDELSPSFAQASVGTEGFTSRSETFDRAVYKNFFKHPKVVGVGECGLDYYRLEEGTRAIQKKNFIEQIELANEVGKPLMLHIRNAYRDAYDILKTHAKVLGNLHFFAGSWEEAKLFLDFGCMLSFTGVITFARDYDEVIRKTPLDRLLSETDCPYVAPAPHRGTRNEPLYVRDVVSKIAEIKNLPLEKTKEQLVKNARRFFSLA